MPRPGYYEANREHLLEYQRAYRDRRREDYRRWDRDRRARLKAEHAHGTCPCGEPLALHNRSGSCKGCRDREAAERLTAAVAAWIAGASMKEVASQVGLKVGSLHVAFANLRAAGVEIPRRSPRGLRWIDPLPDHPVVVQTGDISRGARILAARARSG